MGTECSLYSTFGIIHMGISPNKLHDSLKQLNLHPCLHILMQKVVIHNTCHIPYILESNPHPVFGDFLNEKKVVRDSNPHLSFNHPLPTGRLIE
jgi:hypothetical protein